jgi:pimeloyl-ACP methyl ester carboxylesterase
MGRDADRADPPPAGEGETLVLSDGRLLEVLVDGPPDGTLLVFHHGSPGAAVRWDALSAACAQRHVRVAVYSRPGFGDSTRLPGRSVASCARDVAELADHLGAGRFLTAGWSGGGPHALACAALLPERVVGASTIAGVAPWDATDLDWFEGMGDDNRQEYSIAARDAAELLRWMEPEVRAMHSIMPADIVAAMRSLISEVDEATVNDSLGDLLARSFRAAFRRGLWGWYDDDLAFTRPWGFDLGSIRVPVTIWQGPHDRMVPFAHGQWLAAHIPGARPELRPEHGHLSLAVGSLGEIISGLAEHASRP